MKQKKPKMTSEQRYIFGEITHPIDDGRPHPIEDIKWVAVPKDKIPEYMSLFVEMGLYTFDGKCYTITNKGGDEFKKIRDSLEKVAPGRLVY